MKPKAKPPRSKNKPIPHAIITYTREPLSDEDAESLLDDVDGGNAFGSALGGAVVRVGVAPACGLVGSGGADGSSTVAGGDGDGVPGAPGIVGVVGGFGKFGGGRIPTPPGDNPFVNRAPQFGQLVTSGLIGPRPTTYLQPVQYHSSFSGLLGILGNVGGRMGGIVGGFGNVGGFGIVGGFGNVGGRPGCA